MSMERPTAREHDLITQELPDELLVYDLVRHKAHSLAGVVATIWRACDGQSTVAEILQRARAQSPGLDEGLVQIALARLWKSGLLIGDRPASPSVSSRRELLRRAAVLGGFAVVSITVPTAALAASCLPGLSQGQTNCVNSQCRNSSGVSCCRGTCHQQSQSCGTGQTGFVCD
jgi:hypothetical protein